VKPMSAIKLSRFMVKKDKQKTQHVRFMYMAGLPGSAAAYALETIWKDS
jgi:hypothetical protein